MKPIRPSLSLIFQDKDGKVLVLKRSPHKKSFPGFWSLPSAYILPNESSQEVAFRLSLEKLGIRQVKIQEAVIGVSDLVDRGDYLTKMTDYIVDYYTGPISLNSEEYTDMKWVTPEGLKDLINQEQGGNMGECCRVFLKSLNLI